MIIGMIKFVVLYLLDAKADLLLYGMGEKIIIEVADALNAGIAVEDLVYIRGSV